MKNRKTLWIIAAIVAIVCLVTAVFIIAVNAKKENEKTQTLEALYLQIETAAKSHISFIEIMDDFISYEKAYVENPNWENMNNFRVAAACTQGALEKIPTNVLTLTDEQLEAGRKLGFDVAGLVNFCSLELEANLKSNYNTVATRYMTIENFTLESTYQELESLLSIDEHNVEWSKEYLLLELQSLWADFPKFNAKERLSQKFPEILNEDVEWETDRDMISKKMDKLLTELEELLAEQSRVLGNSEAMLEIYMEQGLKANVIEGLPTMVPHPLFSADAIKTVTYMTEDGEDVDAFDVVEAVTEAKKCTIVYDNVSYEEYIDYLLDVVYFDFDVKETRYDDYDNIKGVTFIVGGSDYRIDYENEITILEIDDIDNMVLVYTWYMMQVSPELFK